jgi:hypothetical protein
MERRILGAPPVEREHFKNCRFVHARRCANQQLIERDQIKRDQINRAVQILHWRPDKAPKECTMDQIRQKKAKLMALLD